MIVIKIGGSIAHRCPELLDEVAQRQDVVLVHGFGPQTTALAEARRVAQRFITSPAGARSRFTDDETLSVLVDAATGVGRDLTAALNERGGNAVHVLGNLGMIRGQVKDALRHQTDDGRVVLMRGNRSGIVESVDVAPLRTALANGTTPVVTPLAFDDRGAISVDADRAAAKIAVELGAELLVLLTDVAQVRDRDGSAIARLSRERARELVEANVAQGGMMRKLLAADEALAAQVDRVVIASGLGAGPLSRALGGQGTEVVE